MSVLLGVFAAYSVVLRPLGIWDLDVPIVVAGQFLIR